MMRGQEGHSRTVFEFFGATLVETTLDVLGIWKAIPTAPSKEVVFETTAAAIAAVPCWRAHLPADLDSANRSLLEGETRLSISEQALPKAATRLEAFVRKASIDLGLTVSSAGTSLEPEAELAHVLSQLREPSISFGLGEWFPDRWEQAAQQLEEFIESVLQVLAHDAWVETSLGKQLIGRTAVRWTGDLETVWQVRLDPAQVALHQRTLALALASRQTLLQLFLLVARGCLMVFTLLATPASPLLVIPAIWQFVQHVLATG